MTGCAWRFWSPLPQHFMDSSQSYGRKLGRPTPIVSQSGSVRDRATAWSGVLVAPFKRSTAQAKELRLCDPINSTCKPQMRLHLPNDHSGIRLSLPLIFRCLVFRHSADLELTNDFSSTT